MRCKARSSVSTITYPASWGCRTQMNHQITADALAQLMGAWLCVLHWLSLRGGPSGNYSRIYLGQVLSGLRYPPTLTPPQSPMHLARVLDLQYAFSTHMAAAGPTAGTLANLYLVSFAVFPQTSTANPDPVNPPEMPYFFSLTSNFHPDHACALMPTRCYSDPFAASTT
jgi:hypothetical protein